MMRGPAQNGLGSTLTFGLEVEFFAAMKATTFNRFPNATIASLLGDRLRLVRLHGPDGTGVGIRVEDDDDDDSSNSDAIDYSFWNLTTDKTAAPNYPEWFECYETQPIEIISPPYRIYSPLWEHDIQRIFNSRSGQYNPIPWRELRMYFEQNSTTGLHVHIGNGTDPDSAFSFHTVRNLAMILLVYEPELDKLLDTSPSWNRMLNEPVYMQCITSVNSPHFQPPNLPPKSPRALMALHLLNTCPDIKSIINVMNPRLPAPSNPRDARYYKYNFTPLLDSLDAPARNIINHDDNNNDNIFPKRKLPTIEFRQQPGTLDPDTMVHWIRFLGAMVDFSGRIGIQTLIEFLGLEEWRLDGANPATAGSDSEDPPSPTYTQHVPTYSTASPPSLSAFSLLSGLQPVGSLSRLLTAMETAHIPLDPDTTRFWRRKYAQIQSLNKSPPQNTRRNNAQSYNL
ncbi:uncharacterized protein CIMG_00374 [Coccidioides immitis RS]|uniref:Amidoligase enzyme n=1 Tax=Coccidioides immitis (strain RS) TaxID=246410 RepID=J3KGV9_COCIM|nr:uncharacterized protein CIMG_00374 [Coccidioides immitis RS]EAS35020.3 hypothetical protein CIMG_00374 [Coccidioides immitis RS]TPX26691.1 hypothetical protein DIZ76_012153 [Coccidioides immitis]